MPKKIAIKKAAPAKKSMGAAVAKSLATVRAAVYRAKSNQPKNTI